MRQALRILLILAVLAPSTLASDAGESVAQARKKIAARDLKGAASLLEDALATAPAADRRALVELLKETYRGLLRDAQAKGSADVATYQDDLAILESASPAPAASPEAPSPTPAPPPAPAPAPSPAIAAAPALAPVPAPAAAEPEVIPHVASPKLEAPRSAPAPGTKIVPPRSFDDQVARAGADVAATPAPAAAPRTPAASPRSAAASESVGRLEREPIDDELPAADALFKEGKFEQACKAYTALAEAGKLPQARTKAWAYCRWAVIVARINSGPKSKKDWDALDREVDSVQKLTPGNWFGDYLKDVVAEGRSGRRPVVKSPGLAVRGASPDEPEPEPTPAPKARRIEREAVPLDLPSPVDDLPAPLPTPPVEPLPLDPDLSAAPAAAPAAPLTSWEVVETPSFRIFHVDADLAAKVAEKAEAVRAAQGTRWGSIVARQAWSPRCDVYLYPTGADFARMTGQPETSPGFSSMGIGNGQVVARRVNLRADHPQVVSAVLPHEITHVVLADIFPEQQIPRWADEGMAVLAEPADELTNRVAELDAPLSEGRVFELDKLMTIDYPAAQDWKLYYAQSVSLTQFLVSQGTPAQFVKFLKTTQSRGTDVALRDVYGMEDVADLQLRWTEQTRRNGAQLATVESSTSK